MANRNPSKRHLSEKDKISRPQLLFRKGAVIGIDQSLFRVVRVSMRKIELEPMSGAYMKDANTVGVFKSNAIATPAVQPQAETPVDNPVEPTEE